MSFTGIRVDEDELRPAQKGGVVGYGNMTRNTKGKGSSNKQYIRKG